ncbi:predicted protein [Uncinocarpus reesii 1704]|uniref:Uncharacterized protein n=1 Tax=Uncinocarpus reesii (strain UAMH 1704) TaxID=336963 RepID=C4JNC4_UNCRE|nr:uncharacterized protein UREG_04330 [Uncinocarpus reesii 1704]EEP79484.1 predicted protein [Uncinocarpus reesii 1704]
MQREISKRGENIMRLTTSKSLSPLPCERMKGFQTQEFRREPNAPLTVLKREETIIKFRIKFDAVCLEAAEYRESLERVCPWLEYHLPEIQPQEYIRAVKIDPATAAPSFGSSFEPRNEWWFFCRRGGIGIPGGSEIGRLEAYFVKGTDDGKDDDGEDGDDEAISKGEEVRVSVIWTRNDGGARSYQLHAFSAETTGFIVAEVDEW